VSNASALRVRRRADVEVSTQSFGRRRTWGLKDPLALRYYHLTDQEFWILEQFDGVRTLDDVRRAFESRFAPQRLSAPMLRGFVDQLHHEGLVVVDTAGQGEVLLKRRTQVRRDARLAACSRLFSIRFRGVDPEAFLRRTQHVVAPLFAPLFWLLALALFLVGLTITAAHIDEVQAELQYFSRFFEPRNLLLGMLVLGATRLVHELGHAYACKHFGGECHELGFMIFMLSPTVYCDVSDSWMFRSKWSRMAVSAAGIGVEIVLASAAAVLWRFTEPGLLHETCFFVMIVCSVNTLLLNGNPLLRYDGYHVLADFVEIPNLARRANDVWRRWAVRLWFGDEAARDVVDPASGPTSPLRELALAAYAAASKVYMMIVLFGSLWILNAWTKNLGLQFVGAILTAAALSAVLIVPTVRGVRKLADPNVDRARYRGRFWLVTALVLAPLGALLFVPLPRTIEAVAVLQPADAAAVYVLQPGFLQSATRARQVAAGEVLAELADDELHRDLLKLEGERARLRVVLDNLEKRQVAAAGPLDLPTARESLATIERRLEKRREDERRLTLRAPRAGTVFAPPDRPATPGESRTLDTWSGSPLDDVNRGAYLATGTLLCSVGDASRVEAIATIDQSDVPFVRPDAAAKLLVDVATNRRLSGRVVEVGTAAVRDERDDAAASASASRGERADAPRAGGPGYQVRIAVPSLVVGAVFDGPIRVRIEAPRESLAAKGLRLLSQTFRFE